MHWGDEDQGDEFALDIINKMGNAGGGAGDHFDHHRRNNNIHYTNNNNNTDRDSMNSSRSNSNYSNNSSAKLRPSAQQKLLANGYGKNSQGNFFNITKRKSMGDHKKKAKRRMSRSRTFVSNTNGKKYNVFEQKKDKDTSHLNQSNVNNNFDEEKSHQPLNPSPKQSPLMVPMNGNNNINMIPRSAPQHPVASPTDNVPHQITLDDFELEHQIDEMNMNNHNRASNNVHKYNNNKPGHQAYYSTHINISQRNSMIPASSPTIQNYQSESVAKEWNRKRSKNKLSGLKQHNKKRKSLKRNFNINGNNGINGYEPNHHQHDQHINVHFNTLENMGISKSAPAPDPSQHRNLGSLTHTELKGFLEADNLFHYNGYNNSNIVQ